MLAKIFPKQPKFVYRWPPTLRNRLVKNLLDPPKKANTFLDKEGFYNGRCLTCTNRKTTHFQSNSTGQQYAITCNSTHITYILECSCGLQYVCRTTRELKTRLREHVNNKKKGFFLHSLFNHVRTHHNRDPSQLKLCGIDKIEKYWRASHMTRFVSQKNPSGFTS